MIEFLEQIDHQLFLLINGAHAPFWDKVMYLISNKYTWIPLYLFLIALIFIKNKKKGIIIVLGIILAIGLSDFISVHFFKEVFQRYRPCHNLELKSFVHIVNGHCGGTFGFVSSHASNSMVIAFLTGIFLKKNFKYALISLLIWAFIVSYSRIYLGVHYPFDIVGGWLVGLSISILCYKLIQYLIGKYNFEK